MDGKDKGEPKTTERSRRDLRRLHNELKELMWLSREYWDGFRMEKEYEIRIYVNKDGIRLFQSSTIEAESPPPRGSPFLR